MTYSTEIVNPTPTTPGAANALISVIPTTDSVPTSPKKSPPEVMHFAFAGSARSSHWKQELVTYEGLIETLMQNTERTTKDGVCYVPGLLINNERKKDTIAELNSVIYDIDGGQSLERVSQLVESAGYPAIVHPTYSHMTTTTDIAVNSFTAFARRKELNIKDGVTIGQIQIYLDANDKNYLTNVVLVDDSLRADGGYVIRLEHDPVQKCRVIIPMKTPFEFGDNVYKRTAAAEVWSNLHPTIGKALGLAYDPSCSDCSRLYFLPAHAPGMFHESKMIGDLMDGDSLLDWRAFEEQAKVHETVRAIEKTAQQKETYDSIPDMVTDRDGHEFDLKTWFKSRRSDFSIMDAYEQFAPGHVVDSGDKVDITCPNEGEHSKPGGKGTFCSDADPDTNHDKWVINCEHHHCKDRGTLFFIHKAIEDGTFSFAELDDCVCDAVQDAKDELAEILSTVDKGIKPTGVGEIVELAVATGDEVLILEAYDILNHQGGYSQTKLNPIFKQKRNKRNDAMKAAEKERVNAKEAEQNAAVAKVQAEALEGGEELTWAEAHYLAMAENVQSQPEALHKPLAWMSSEHSQVTVGSKQRVLHEMGDDFEFMQRADFINKYEDLIVPVVTDEGDSKEYEVAKYWLRYAPKKHYDRIVFVPCGPDADDPAKANEYNMWRGFAVKPRKGDWSRMKRHVFNNVCQRDKELFRWLLGWMAQLVQDPANKMGTAVILKGLKGTGKSKLGDHLVEIIGTNNSITVAEEKHLTGQFNGHMARCIFVLGEEITWGGYENKNSVLKHLITGLRMMIENKGIDATSVDNHIHLMATTNKDWSVPASEDERRFFVLEVGEEQMKNGKYFGAIDDEMYDGGQEAMLYDLLHFDYSNIDLRNPPRTDALRGEIEQGFAPHEKWLMDAIAEGYFTTYTDMENGSTIDLYFDAPREIDKAKVLASYKAFARDERKKPISANKLTRWLKKFGVTVDRDRSGHKDKRVYIFPDIHTLATDFFVHCGVSIDMDVDQYIWKPQETEHLPGRQTRRRG